MAPPQTRYARNGDVHIAFHVFGDGPIDLLYVPNSFSVAEYLWEHPALARFLARMGSFARVIMFDRRESGMSDRLGRPPTLEEQMDDVIAVLDAAGSERTAVYAMLEGGPMAMMFAATHPERCGALVLYATFARTTWAPDYEWAWTAEERALGQERLHANWGDGSIIEGMAPSYTGDQRLRDWIAGLQRYAMGPAAARALGEVNTQLDVRPILPSIRVPTLVLHRRGDQGIVPAHSEYLARAIPGARLRMLDGVDNLAFLGDSEALLDEVEEFLTGARGTRDRDRVLATVLLSDICGSTQRAAAMGDGPWRDLLREHHDAAARVVTAFQGRLIKSTGDGILATFDGPARGIRAGETLVEEARAMALDLRVGVHTGEIELLGDDVSGMAVHIAARVMDSAGPGEVVVSSTVRDLVVGSRLAFEDRGTHELRGRAGRLAAVVAGGLITLDERGRRSYSGEEIGAAAAALELPASRGDVVLTLIGNRVEWVVTMVACFARGLVALPCNEQLRAKDLRMRLEVTRPAVVVAHSRNAGVLREAGWNGATVWAPFEPGSAPVPAPPALGDGDPCLITFTSGTAGEPKGVLHSRHYLGGQALQAEHWLAARPGDLVWCTAASGWSKSARNVFIAPWLRGATALLHDARFDPAERLDIVEREGVNVLCMAPTEYRVIAKRVPLRALAGLRELVAAGEALNPEVLHAWREATGLEIRDGYGQTETGQLTGNLAGQAARPGSMGRALPGVSLWVSEDGELLLDPRTDPTFFTGYVGEDPWPRDRPWHTGDRVRMDGDGYVYFEGRTDDVIISAGYRIGPFEVESALVAHPAVAEAAVVAAPDEERGSIVRAVVVLRDGHTGTPELARELQEHVRAETAPYKYPRIVDFADELPKTTSGKIRRAALRPARVQ